MVAECPLGAAPVCRLCYKGGHISKDCPMSASDAEASRKKIWAEKSGLKERVAALLEELEYEQLYLCIVDSNQQEQVLCLEDKYNDNVGDVFCLREDERCYHSVEVYAGGG